MKKLGFGLMRLPQIDDGDKKIVDEATVLEMMKTFIEGGFTYFDTAYMYHRYQSENVVGRTLVKNFPRDSYTLADKLPMMYVKCAEDMPRFFEEQLQKCQVEYFDYYMLHDLNTTNYDSKVVPFKAFEFISKLKEEGKVREIGFSFHDGEELLDRILTDHPEVDFVQLQINYIDWDDVGIQSRRCYECATRHGKKVIVMEPVKGGTLADVPEAAEKIFKSYSPDSSVASWAIKFAASLPNVFMVLSGMSNMDQMLDNMSYMKDFTPLCDEEYVTIEKALNVIKEAVEIPCTACGYCLEGCPKNIAISKYFALYNTEALLGFRGFSSNEGYYFYAAEKHGKASDCIGCGLCENICPQHLKIRDHLKTVASYFEKN